MIGVGIALAQPSRRVLVLTGDGEMLMGLGALATAAAQTPPNLAVAVLDNGRYGETGGQMSHTALGADLAAIALGSGWREVCTVTETEDLEVLRKRLRSEPVFAVVKISAAETPRHLPPRDGAFLHHRSRNALSLAPIVTKYCVV